MKSLQSIRICHSVARPSLRPSVRVRSEAEAAPAAAPATPGAPEIVLDYSNPDNRIQGRTSTVSGDILRDALMAEKVEIYDKWGKLMNCGGGGSCGTCIVDIVDGAELCGQRDEAEERKLKSKPASWRLACQTNLGDGKSSGLVRVVLRPQARK